MRGFLIVLFATIAISASAQINVDAIDLLTDSTFQEAIPVDTMYWQFEQADKTMDGKTIALYRAKLIKRTNGVEVPLLDSGVVRNKEYKAWLRTQKVWIDNDIEVTRKTESQLKDLLTAINVQLQ